ncbi:MAG: amidase family protein, partial [Actinomycetota bacterium]|nr:amidase family protein [Actinomycetota bacterium]
MNLKEYTRLDATALAGLVRDGQVRPTELAQLAVEAIGRVNRTLNGVIEIYDDALEQDDAAGELFAGVPFLRKDIGATEQGRLVEMGSRLCEGMIAPRDAFYTQRAKAAGLRFLGRTTTSEFGLHGTTETLACGATRNPWNPELIAGGSSGGAAAMVAAGAVPMAHASDGGGSIRIPACVNGLVGLKPSRGRVTAGPAMGHPKLTTELVVSRTVRDTAAALDALAGNQPGEPFDIVHPEQSWRSALDAVVRPLRIAFTTRAPNGAALDPEVAANIEATAAALEGLGHHVEPGGPDYGFERLQDAFGKLFAVVGTGAIKILAERLGRTVDETFLEPVTLRWYEVASSMDALTYDDALSTCDRIARRMGLFHQDYDLALSPVLAQLPPALGTHGGTQHHLTHAESVDLVFELFPFTPAMNLSGQPAISVPTGS